MSENTINDVRIEDDAHNDDDTARPSEQPKMVEKPVTSAIPTTNTNLDTL